MGTNFYLRCKTPRPVHDRYHIAKTSGGWMPLFEANPPAQDDRQDAPDEDAFLEIESIADIKRCYDTGRFELVDEEGDVYDWESFVSRVVDWEGGSWCEKVSEHEGSVGYPVFVDEDTGKRFARYEFC